VTDRSGYDEPLGGFNKLIGLRIVEASGERVVAALPVTPELFQPYGQVHGGVYAAAVETTASLGAHLAMDGKVLVVGISNHTDFLRAVRGGELRTEATPLAVGRSTQLWQADVTDDRGRLVAHGKVRIMHLDPPASAPPA
jgi:1,4-dihydroxy-2-naphthoyl-CoA hydrolase